MPTAVMPGLVPGIHEFSGRRSENVDGRDEPGHDDVEAIAISSLRSAS